jgi:hypothetical protein
MIVQWMILSIIVLISLTVLTYVTKAILNRGSIIEAAKIVAYSSATMPLMALAALLESRSITLQAIFMIAVLLYQLYLISVGIRKSGIAHAAQTISGG